MFVGMYVWMYLTYFTQDMPTYMPRQQTAVRQGTSMCLFILGEIEDEERLLFSSIGTELAMYVLTNLPTAFCLFPSFASGCLPREPGEPGYQMREPDTHVSCHANGKTPGDDESLVPASRFISLSSCFRALGGRAREKANTRPMPEVVTRLRPDN